MDNSPLWDPIMLRMHLRPEDIPAYRRADTHRVAVGDRPVDAAYDRFAYLVRFFAERDYDEARIREDCPFLVQDVLFNTLLCQSGRDLAKIARAVGEDPGPFEEGAAKTARAIDEKLWDEGYGIHLDLDLTTGERLRAYTASGFSPLYAGIPDASRARRMLGVLEDFGLRAKDTCPVPSYDRYGYAFSPVQYWRGPVWVNINWLLLRGLERYGFEREAAHLRRTTVELVRQEGFHEYFHSTRGYGHGSDFFSWTAALILDILYGEAAREAGDPASDA